MVRFICTIRSVHMCESVSVTICLSVASASQLLSVISPHYRPGLTFQSVTPESHPFTCNQPQYLGHRFTPDHSVLCTILGSPAGFFPVCSLSASVAGPSETQPAACL